jgi:hypothetical protein
MLSIFSKLGNPHSHVNARAMRIFLSLLCLLFSFSADSSVPPPSKVIQVESFNQLKVGDSIERLSQLSRERSRWGTPRHVAQFYFYLLRSDLPSRCLNLQCGRFARKIMMNDGFLVGGADLQLAKEVGLDFVSATTNQRQSLLIVTNASGKVTHLFENVTPGSLDEIIRQVSAR